MPLCGAPAGCQAAGAGSAALAAALPAGAASRPGSTVPTPAASSAARARMAWSGWAIATSVTTFTGGSIPVRAARTAGPPGSAPADQRPASPRPARRRPRRRRPRPDDLPVLHGDVPGTQHRPAGLLRACRSWRLLPGTRLVRLRVLVGLELLERPLVARTRAVALGRTPSSAAICGVRDLLDAPGQDDGAGAGCDRQRVRARESWQRNVECPSSA